jgi:hypothetical protein
VVDASTLHDHEARAAKAHRIYADSFHARHADIVTADPGAVVLARNTKNIDRQSAYLVAYRFGGEFNQRIEALSRGLHRALGGRDGDSQAGGLIYGRSNAHVTLSDYRLRPDIELPDGDIDARWVQKALQWAIEQAAAHVTHAEHFSPELYVNFGFTTDEGAETNGVFTNGQTVIITGTPSPGLDWLTGLVIDYAAQRDVELKWPWGYHTTVFRLLADYPRQEIGQFLDRIAEEPVFGRCQPVSLEAGYFNTMPTSEPGFDYVRTAGVELKA